MRKILILFIETKFPNIIQNKNIYSTEIAVIKKTVQ